MTATLEPRTTSRLEAVPAEIESVGRPSSPTDSSGAADVDLDQLASELEAIREEVLADLGQEDADYIRRIIRIQRRLEMAGRLSLMAGVLPPAWVAGVAMLSVAKILENMEIGHNVMHGQWDWMRDPEIHSTTWEWDNVCPASQWKHSHNYLHHHFTNVRGMDHDIGYGVIRVSERQHWYKWNAAQPLIFVALASLFQWGVGVHDLAEDIELGKPVPPENRDSVRAKLREFGRKAGRQVLKDYVAFPALAAPLGAASVVSVVTGNLAANLARNLWSFAVIFCGHFPEGVEIFEPSDIEDESKGHWYYRQIRGSANFTGGRIMDIMSGNLNHQVEHHLFPDLPSSRYAEVAPKVQEVCARHGIEYNSGSFARQFGSVIQKVWRLARP